MVNCLKFANDPIQTQATPRTRLTHLKKSAETVCEVLLDYITNSLNPGFYSAGPESGSVDIGFFHGHDKYPKALFISYGRCFANKPYKIKLDLAYDENDRENVTFEANVLGTSGCGFTVAIKKDDGGGGGIKYEGWRDINMVLSWKAFYGEFLTNPKS